MKILVLITLSLFLIVACGRIWGGVSSSNPCITSGLLSLWSGASVSGSTVVDIVSGNNGTAGAGFSLGVGLGSGTSMNFNGTPNSIVSVPYSANLNLSANFSIAAWVKGNSVSNASTQTILSKWGFNSGGLSTASNWSAVDITSASALNNVNYKGFFGSVFDGRYIYFMPEVNGAGKSGFVAQFDTTGSLTSPSSWNGVDISSASALNSGNYKGFNNGVFDGRYIYFVPNSNGAIDGFVARYDTTGSLTSPTSWAGVDVTSASALNSANYKGFTGAIFDGRYVYFVPYANGAQDGFVAQYDTTGSLTSPGSWNGVDISGASALNNASYRGFKGGIFDGRYVYFSPTNNGVQDGFLARYDTKGSLTSPASWSGVDITSASALNSGNYKGFDGAVFDGRYIYFVPNQNGAQDGFVAQYDTTGSLTSSGSWNGVDISGASALNNATYRGYVGGGFDGRYVYFIPNNNGVSDGSIAQYDTTGSLTSPASWSGVDITSASAVNNVNYTGFQGAGFDGRYLYVVPHSNGALDGLLARYDTTGANAQYSLSYNFTDHTGWTNSPINAAFTINSSNVPFTVSYSQNLTGNTWHFIVGTYDGTTLNLYIDGVLSASRATTAIAVASSSGLALGGLTSGGGAMNGGIDQIQFYGKVLSSAEVTSIYSSGISGLCQ